MLNFGTEEEGVGGQHSSQIEEVWCRHQSFTSHSSNCVTVQAALQLIILLYPTCTIHSVGYYERTCLVPREELYISKIVASILPVLRCLGQQDIMTQVTWYSDYSHTDSGKQFVKGLGIATNALNCQTLQRDSTIEGEA